MTSHETQRWTGKESFSGRRPEILRAVAEVVERLVVREVAELVAYHGETASTTLAGREKSPASHHPACHLLHPALFAALVLKPDLKKIQKKVVQPEINLLPEAPVV